LPVSQADLEKLKAASFQEDVDCLIVTDKNKMASIAELA